jgi:hypothetical protein
MASEEKLRIPAFARAFPEDPALTALVDAFSRGDYAFVRQGTLELEQRAGQDEIRHAARLLRARTRPAPASAALIGLSALLLILLSVWWTFGPGVRPR